MIAALAPGAPLMYSLREYSEAELPDPQAAIEQGLAFISQVETGWAFVKDFPSGVRTYKHWESRDYWVARVSEHRDASYEDMLATLFDDHTANEAEYIAMIASQRALDASSSGAYTSSVVTYKFPFPLRDRDMAIWSTKRETVPGSQFVVLTLPRRFDSPRTKGLYIAVEVVTRVGDAVRWQMATTSDAGGWLPQAVQRPQLPSAVAEDIPLYFKWLRERKRKTSTDTDAAGGTAAAADK